MRAASDRQAARSKELRARFAAALDAFGTGDLAAAREGFSAILRVSPGDKEAAAMLGRTDDAIGHSVDAAVADANRLIDWGVLDEAETVLAQARELRPNDAGARAASARLTEALATAQRRATGAATAPDSSAAIS